MTIAADAQLVEALAALWRLPRPGPNNLLAEPAFVALNEVCAARYGETASFALSSAVRSLGLPCYLPAKQVTLALDVATAAGQLHDTYRRKRRTRRHLCPLDLAGDLPELAFGGARVARFGSADLARLFDAPRLARNFPNQPLEAERLAQFHWLVVEEEIELDPRPDARAAPFMFQPMNRDFGEIDPHLGRFPPAVEGALFFLLLAPWEEWVQMQELDWRGFRVPWIFTLDDDLFVRPAPPPSPDSLTLEPLIVEDDWGEEIELERPSELPLDEAAVGRWNFFTDSAWSELEAARAAAVFETPVAHFLVRAFLSDGMDEVMAHMTTIEAAVGLESDHRRKLRPRPDPHPKCSSTERVAARLAAALADPGAARDYKRLFELRSAYVHGRAGLGCVSTADRVLARRLARRVVLELVPLSARPRLKVMAELLDRGVAYL